MPVLGTRQFLDALYLIKKRSQAGSHAIVVYANALAEGPDTRALRDRLYFLLGEVAGDLHGTLYALNYRVFVIIAPAGQADTAIANAAMRIRMHLLRLLPIYGTTASQDNNPVPVERVDLRHDMSKLKRILHLINKASSSVQGKIYPKQKQAPAVETIRDLLADDDGAMAMFREYSRTLPIVAWEKANAIEHESTEVGFSIHQLRLDGFDHAGRMDEDVYRALREAMEDALLRLIGQRASLAWLKGLRKLSINVARTSLAHADLHAFARRIHQRLGAPVRLEIAAEDILADPDVFDRQVRQLSQDKVPVEIAADNASLAHAKQLEQSDSRVDAVKLAADDLRKGGTGDIERIVRWGRRTDRMCIVTRLDDPGLASTLHDLGVTHVQGIIPDEWLRAKRLGQASA